MYMECNISGEKGSEARPEETQGHTSEVGASLAADSGQAQSLD